MSAECVLAICVESKSTLSQSEGSFGTGYSEHLEIVVIYRAGRVLKLTGSSDPPPKSKPSAPDNQLPASLPCVRHEALRPGLVFTDLTKPLNRSKRFG